MTEQGNKKTPERHGRVYEVSHIAANRRRTRLWLILFGLITMLLLVGVQTVLLDRVVIAGRDCGSPGLCLCFVMAVGYIVDREMGGLAGLACGFVLDGALGSDIMLRPVVYFLLGWLCGRLGDKLLAHNAPSFAVFCAVGAVADAVREAVCLYTSCGTLPGVGWLLRTQLPALLLTVVCAPPVWWGVRAGVNRIKK